MLYFFKPFIFTVLFFVSSTAHAYIGPGAGLSALGSVIALVGGLLLLIIGFLWYPLKRFFKKTTTDNTVSTKESSDK